VSVDSSMTNVLGANVVPVLILASDCATVTGAAIVGMVVVSWVLTRVEASSVVVRHAEVLRYSVLVTGVGNSAAIARATWVRSRLELLFNSSVLIATKVINLVGMLAVDSLTAAVARRAVRALARTRVVLSGGSALHTMVALRMVFGLILADSVVVAYLLTRVEASSVVVRVLEVLRYSALVTGVSNSTAIAGTTRVIG